MSKPILCLDFDGVIHSYTSGWQGADEIPDKPVEGAIGFLTLALPHFNIAIYSSRSGQTGGIEAMQEWLFKHANDFWIFDQLARFDEAKRQANNLCDQIQWPTEKPPAMVSIDDRAITFTGTWPDISELKSFKPWNKPSCNSVPIGPDKERSDIWIDQIIADIFGQPRHDPQPWPSDKITIDADLLAGILSNAYGNHPHHEAFRPKANVELFAELVEALDELHNATSLNDVCQFPDPLQTKVEALINKAKEKETK